MEFIHDGEKLRQMASDAVVAALRAGADEAAADADESVGMEVNVRRGALEDMDIHRGQDLSVAVYVGGREGAASIGELNIAAIKTAVDRAMTIARASAPDPCAGLADKHLMAREIPDLGLYHPKDIAPEEAVAAAKQCEESSFLEKISRDKSGGAAVSTGAGQNAYANSHGFCALEKSTAYTISCSAIAEEQNEMESDGWSETRRDFLQLPAAETVGAAAAHRAARRLRTKKIPSTRAAALFWPPASHSLIGHLVSAASGGALYRKTSWLLDCLDKPVCAAHINLRERPHLPGEMRSAAYDDEGAATAERDIVAGGVWRGCFLGAYSARKLGLQSTANAGGAHNLEVSGEALTQEQLLREMGRGLIVTDLMGQGVNPVTGDYSRAAAGFWVEGGEIVHPVNEITVAGNIRRMLLSIRAVGNDAMRRGLIKCGSILIPDLHIGANN